MPVTHQHDDFVKFSPIWKKSRDVTEGQEAVHGGGVLYLNTLVDEKDADYRARVDRAVFYDATARTIEGMLGMLFRKSPVVEINQFEDLLNNIDLQGNDITQFLKSVSKEALTVNRFGLLIDYPFIADGSTLADALKVDARPSMNLYKAETIINWKTMRINGKQQLSQVVLVEDVTVPMDEFQDDTEKHYRVLDLFEGHYRVRVFDKDDTQIVPDLFPTMSGKKQTTIPFFFYPTIDPQRPALLGLVNMNLSHYQTTADYEHGCHLSGLPTLFISGYTPVEGHTVYIGGPTAQALPESDAKAYYVEVGNDFQALRDNLKDKEARMGILGSRMLQEQKKQTEAAETAGIHRAGEVSTLSAMSIALSTTFNEALRRMIEWAGATNPEVNIELNRDYVPATMNYQMVSALLQAVQAGEVSSQAFFENLKAGELYPENIDYEAEQERISSTPPPTPDK